MLSSVASARSQYRLYLEQGHKKRESFARTPKRKAAEEELRQQLRVLDDVYDILENDANKLAKGKAGSKMAQLITKYSTFRRRYKEKKRNWKEWTKLLKIRTYS